MGNQLPHEWSPGNPRCIHCGTLFAMHAAKAQACVPRWTSAEAKRPEPVRRQYAMEDFDTIQARMKELDAERVALLSRPENPAG